MSNEREREIIAQANIAVAVAMSGALVVKKAVEAAMGKDDQNPPDNPGGGVGTTDESGIDAVSVDSLDSALIAAVVLCLFVAYLYRPKSGQSMAG